MLNFRQLFVYIAGRLEVPDEDYLEVVVAYVDLQSCFIRLIGEDFSVSVKTFALEQCTFYF